MPKRVYVLYGTFPGGGELEQHFTDRWDALRAKRSAEECGWDCRRVVREVLREGAGERIPRKTRG